MTSPHQPGWKMSLIGIPLVLGILTGLLFMSDSPIWWKKLFATGFTGGCGKFVVYAQNRWQPYGAAVRLEPSVESKQIASYSPNYAITVDGWLHAEVAYPTNPPPYNNDVWFHLANEPGWVSFGGVRGVPTVQDPTAHSADGGQPAPLSTACEGEIR